MNTTEFLNITSLIVPERTAIVFDGKRFSFHELEERVKKLANALSKMPTLSSPSTVSESEADYR